MTLFRSSPSYTGQNGAHTRMKLPASYDACNKNISSFEDIRMGMNDNNNDKAELLLKIIEHVSGY